MPRGQTQSSLTQQFAAAGIRPQTRFGQNFLIDLNLLDILLDAARLSPQDVVLEVGTGTGSLTTLLAERTAHVVSVEIDPGLLLLAQESLADRPNVTLLQLDALASKNTLDPSMLEILQARLQAVAGARFKLVANLPYNVATPLISNFLAGELRPEAFVITIQKEVADRLVAAPASSDYGALSVWVQAQCQAEIVRILPPTAFWPRPKVDSAIVRILPDPALRARLRDPAGFLAFVRALFLHRRKFLRSGVESATAGRVTKPQADSLLAALGFPATVRAEELPPERLMALFDRVSAALQTA